MQHSSHLNDTSLHTAHRNSSNSTNLVHILRMHTLCQPPCSAIRRSHSRKIYITSARSNSSDPKQKYTVPWSARQRKHSLPGR